jgi:hypothetical protein
MSPAHPHGSSTNPLLPGQRYKPSRRGEIIDCRQSVKVLFSEIRPLKADYDHTPDVAVVVLAGARVNHSDFSNS